MPISSTEHSAFSWCCYSITAGRDKSIQLIKDANKGSKVIGVVSQKDEGVEDPLKMILKNGTVARILKVLKMPDGNTTIIIQGKKRFEINEITETFHILEL